MNSEPEKTLSLKELLESSGISTEKITILNTQQDSVLFIQFGPTTDPKSVLSLKKWWEEISSNFIEEVPAFFLFNVSPEQMQLNLVPKNFYEYMQKLFAEGTDDEQDDE